MYRKKYIRTLKKMEKWLLTDFCDDQVSEEINALRYAISELERPREFTLYKKPQDVAIYLTREARDGRLH